MRHSAASIGRRYVLVQQLDEPEPRNEVIDEGKGPQPLGGQSELLGEWLAGLRLLHSGDNNIASSRHRDYWTSQQCLAVIYEKLGRHADAQAELAKIKAQVGDASAYQYAAIYAQWGDRAKALEWLDTAMRLRDPGLVQPKTDPLMDPLRQEPAFQAILRELSFPI